MVKPPKRFVADAANLLTQGAYKAGPVFRAFGNGGLPVRSQMTSIIGLARSRTDCMADLPACLMMLSGSSPEGR